MQAIEILLDSAHGIYIPQLFIETLKPEYLESITEEQKEDLADPYNEYYWDTWNDILINFELELDGNIYELYQDGDLFLYCYDLMTEEEKENFFQD